MSTQEIIDQAIALPPDERERVAELLYESLHAEDYADSESVDKEWEKIIERRLEDVESGKVKTIPGDVVLANLRKLLDK